ncbi:MAG TPA: hypothetical protein VK589_23375 [Chryseolinea sp.]|nr:hypothetical protein [Chryseolinea sp.]
MDTNALDRNIIMTIDRLTIPSWDENTSPNCPSFQKIVEEFETLDERKRVTARMLELKDMNVLSFYRTDPIIVSITGEMPDSLDAQSNQAIAEWRRRFYPWKGNPGKESAGS